MTLKSWPMRVVEAQWTSLDRLDPPVKAPGAFGGAAGAPRLPGRRVRFSGLPLNTLRFYLNGAPALIHTLYELLCNNCRSIRTARSAARGSGSVPSS
jgi:type VI secretion system protein ImpG